MSPYGGADDDNESTASFSIMGDEEDTFQTDKIKSDIRNLLRRKPRKLNILVIGPPGVGKSAFISSLATALSGHFHEYSLSGHHGGGTRPITFFMKRFEDCCLDEDYKQSFPDCKLPTLTDMAGMPNENNKTIYEEILRTILYGRLPLNMSIAQAEEILTQEGVNQLRKQCPCSDPDLMIDRILFVSAASENALSQELIECVVNTCRPSGTSSNSRNRAIPLYGVMTKIDKVDVNSTDYNSLEQKFQEALGIRGSSNRFVRCSNYCDDTAPDRSDVNSASLDIPLLKFFKQLVDPFVNVDFDGEQEDYSHLSPPPLIPPRVNPIDHYFKRVDNFFGRISLQSLVAVLVGLLAVLVVLYASGSRITQDLKTTCMRIKHMGGNGRVSDLPELFEICKSLEHGQRFENWLLLPVILLIILAVCYKLSRPARVN